jgi:hypothetical protein
MSRLRIGWGARLVLLGVVLVALLYAGSMVRVEQPPPPLPTPVLAVPSSQIEVQVLNETGVPGHAVRVARFLRERGFDVVETGNGTRVGLAETEVVVRGEDMEKGARIAQSLNCVSVKPGSDADELVDVTVFVGKDIDRLVVLPP